MAIQDNKFKQGRSNKSVEDSIKFIYMTMCGIGLLILLTVFYSLGNFLINN